MHSNELSMFLAVVAQILIGLIYLYAGIMKVAHWREFSQTVHRFDIGRLAALVRVSVPFGEMTVGLGMLFCVYMPLMVIGSIVLILIFTSAVVWSMRNRLDISCSCFGNSKENLDRTTLLRCLLLAIALFFASQQASERSIPIITHSVFVTGLLLVIFSAASQLNKNWQSSLRVEQL